MAKEKPKGRGKGEFGPAYGRSGQVQHFKDLRLPNLLKRYTAKGPGFGKVRDTRRWILLAEMLPVIEEQLCAWEAANPEVYRDLPWYEAREAFKEMKAHGEVVWPTWWELAGGLQHSQQAAQKAAYLITTWPDAKAGIRSTNHARKKALKEANKKKPSE